MLHEQPFAKEFDLCAFPPLQHVPMSLLLKPNNKNVALLPPEA
jgi:hypothetical protein